MLLLILSIFLAAAGNNFGFGSNLPQRSQGLIWKSSSIPGGSPLEYCPESRPTDLYSFDRVELVPNPLRIDDVFEVHLYGTFAQNITNNATWTMRARGANGSSDEYEEGTWDFCDALDSIEQPDPGRKQTCPPEKGFALIMMSGWVMPMFIVPGEYYFRFDAVTKEGERIYCLETTIQLEERREEGSWRLDL